MTGRRSSPFDERAGRHARRRRRGRRWLATLGYLSLFLVCAAVATATFIIAVTPFDFVRDHLVQQVKARTGRNLEISGATSVSLFPRASLDLTNVALSAPSAMGGAPMVVAEGLEVEVGLIPLLLRQPVIRRLVLTRPVIELRVDAEGRRSWEFAHGPPGPLRLAQLAGSGREQPTATDARSGTRAPEDGRLADTLEGLVPSRLRIIDGTVRYADERDGLSHEVSALDLDLRFEGPGGPLEGKGGLAWRGEKLSLQGLVSPLRALLEERHARLSLKVSGRPIEASYEGVVKIAASPTLEGKADLKAASTAALGAWLAKPGAAGRDAGELSLSTRLSAADGRLSLQELSATVGEMRLTGALTVDTGGVRPHLGGTLSVSELDLGRLLTRSGGRTGTASSDTPPDPASPELRRFATADLRGHGAPQDASQSPPGPKKRVGAGGRQDWSDDPIDLAPFALADADLALTAERVVYKDLASGQARLKLALKDKVATLTLEDMLLYSGRGRGTLTLDGSGEVPATGADLKLDGVSAAPLLRDALGLDWLDGRSTIVVAVGGQGSTERQIVEALNGKVEAQTVNGSLAGVDVDKLLQNIEHGKLAELQTGPGEKTQFSDFTATFAIAAGVASNKDLRLIGPRVRVTGEGMVDLGNRRIDYTLNPKIVGGISAPGAVVKIKDLEIPVRVEGAWDKPAYSVMGQERVGETLKRIGKNLKSREVQDAIKGLIEGDEQQTRIKPRELLEKLLKKQ
jgi:AsmA protein